MQRARLTRYGLLSVTGSDARAFLHAQLTNDIENLPAERSALAGWCSAKGRLLASFLVIPSPQGFLQIGPVAQMTEPANADEVEWTLQEIRAGRPLITGATQDQFVPQMVNFEALGGVDFRKGCYPGQEIVARAQYRGQVKRRMVHARAPVGVALQPGQEFNGGTVGDVAPAEGGAELLAVMPVWTTTSTTRSSLPRAWRSPPR